MSINKKIRPIEEVLQPGVVMVSSDPDFMDAERAYGRIPEAHPSRPWRAWGIVENGEWTALPNAPYRGYPAMTGTVEPPPIDRTKLRSGEVVETDGNGHWYVRRVAEEAQDEADNAPFGKTDRELARQNNELLRAIAQKVGVR